MSAISQIWHDGLWRNNAGFVQLLGLCPLLAVSSTVVNSIGLGLATLLTLIFSNLAVSLVRRQMSAEIRIPAFVIIIAVSVSLIELLMQAYQFQLYQTLGIFVPLIVTNCAILARAEAFASRNNAYLSLHDALATGVGFSFVLILLGSIRELIGHGSLFANIELLMGSWSSFLTINLSSQPDATNSGFLFALLPPGAFITLGLLIAARNLCQQRATIQKSKLKQEKQARPQSNI